MKTMNHDDYTQPADAKAAIPETLTWDESLKKLRDAGLDSWDKIENPEEYLGRSIPDDHPAWRDRPTVPGDYAWKRGCFRGLQEYTAGDIAAWPATSCGYRYYGPIPQDTRGA